MSIQRSIGPALPITDALKKLYIQYEESLPDVYTGKVTALFNPNQLRYNKEVSWAIEPINGVLANAQWVAFQSTRPQTLTLDLFFDTYEGDPTAIGSAIVRGLSALVPDNPVSSALARPSGADVTSHANQVANLARVRTNLHRPPRCKLWWGRYLLLRGVLTSVSEEYTRFLADGTPVRGNLTCTFSEAVSDATELHSADVNKQRTVRRGETLSGIALEEYNDASQWRLIAAANRITNPRLLAPGTLLVIPRLPPLGSGS